ncbi:MAG: cupin domain-containing protein [Pseudomonadales bacterium]|nr:cupin domain-containing protein [Pseudomonadales bacterium]
MKSILGSLSEQQFLDEYWQKKPLLIRGALPGFRSPITADELAALACEAQVDSRLVIEKGFESPWQVLYDPLDPSVFSTLPESHWTLLVTDVEKHLPEMSEITDRFRFIPDWRIDDLMVSYAPKGGSVGPHWDTYDVFLLQGLGHRRWQISELDLSEDNYLDGIDLRIMERFNAQQDWILEPGDMLYLPPHIAHHGVAQDECMTFSIGFRAPPIRDMLTDYSDYCSQGLTDSDRYRDPKLVLQRSPGEISGDAIADIQALLLKQLEQPSADFAKWFGGYTTTPKTELCAPPEQPVENFAEWQNLFDQADGMLRSTASRFAYTRSGDDDILAERDSAMLFVDGDGYQVSLRFAQWLCSSRRLSALPENQPLATNEQNTLIELHNLGCLYFYDKDTN